MDPNISESGDYPVLQEDCDEICYSSSLLEPTGQTDDTELDNSANQPGMEYTQLLVADSDTGALDESWPPSLTTEFIEQCIHALDAINDSSCLTVSDDQLSLLYSGIASVEEHSRVVSIDDFQGQVSLENLETEDMISFQWPSVDGTDMSAPDSVADSEITDLDPDSTQLDPDSTQLDPDSIQLDPDSIQLNPDSIQLDCSVQPALSVDLSGVPGLCQPLPSAAAPLPVPAAWSEQPWDCGAAPSQEQLVWRPGSADSPVPCVPLSDHRGSLDPVVGFGAGEQAAWSVAPAAEADPRPADSVSDSAGWWRSPPLPPSAAARLAEVECELTVSEETEAEVAPPGGGPATVDLAPYQEHNYDYPLEPLVAGEVRPSADHQYASRPASPGDAACSATDHRYAYSPPAALTEEDLIRSISDQLGLPQDHGYSQRQGPAPGHSSLPPPPARAPAVPTPTPTPTGPGWGSESADPRGAEPCLVTESCPPDWDPTLDEPAGHWVDPNLVMGLTTGWQPEEEVGDDGDVAPTTQLFDGADAVLRDEELWESGAAVLDEAGSSYVVLDVVERDSMELNETMDVALQDSGGNEQGFGLDEDVEAKLLDFNSPGESQVSLTVADPPSEEPATATALLPDAPSFDMMDSSSPPHSSPAEAEEPPLADTLPAPAGTELLAAIPDIPPVTEPEPLHETNIVISRPAEGSVSASPPPPAPSPPPSSPPARLPEADPAAMVRGWLRRRAAAQQPVTRALLSGELTTLLGPERRRRLSDNGDFLAQWLDRLTAPEGAAAAGGNKARLSYPPDFKLMVLRFSDFMPPDQLGAAFCVPFTLVYKWRSKRRELAELARTNSGSVRAKGGGKKRSSTAADAEFASWLEQRERESDAPPSYGEVRQKARQLYSRAGQVPRLRLFQRERSVTNRRRDHSAIRWLLAEFELGRATDRAALAAYGLQPGGLDWARRLLARHPPLRRPLATWQMALPELLLTAAEEWAGALETPPPHAVTVMADVPIVTRPAPCAVWRSEDSEHLATLLISCTLEGSVLPSMLILKGGGRRVYSDSGSGLLTVQQEAGRLDAARAGLWLQLVGSRRPARLLLINSCCAPRPDQLRGQAAAAGCRLALVPPGLAAVANPLMASRQRLMMSIAASLGGGGGGDSDLLSAVRAQLAGWGDCPQLKQDLARVERLYRSVPPIPAG